MELWTTLTEGTAFADAIDLVAAAYATRTGRAPERTPGRE
jgi:hypothetical protein